MNADKRLPKRSPWMVVEVFVLFLMASTFGEFMGAVMGDPSQLGLAVMELAIGLALAWPALSGLRWAYVCMGLYLLFFGFATAWLLLRSGGEAVSPFYHWPLAIFFAAGGLKLLLTRPRPERP